MKNILILSLFLASCGKPSDVNLTQNMQVQLSQCTDVSMRGSVRYKYTYTTDICTTDCHSTQSYEDYCESLRNEQLNNYCAKDERQKALKDANCGE